MLGLLVGESEPLAHPLLGFLLGTGRPDDRDDLIDVIHCDEKTLIYMTLVLILLKIVPGPSRDDFFLVLYIVTKCISQSDELGLELAVLIGNKREHIGAACILERAVLVELVQYDVRVCILLEFYYDPYHLASVRLVPYSGDAFYLLVLDKISHPLDESCLVDCKRQIVDDDPCLCAGPFDLGMGSYHYPAASCGICFPDAHRSEDRSSRREIRALDYGHELIDRNIGVIYHHDNAVYNLTKIVRRYVCCHTYGDTYGSVNEKVRES